MEDSEIMAELKRKRKELLDKLDQKLQENLVDPLHKRSETLGKVGSGIAAGVSSVADFLTPEDAADAAILVAGGGAIKGATKLLKKLKKAKKGRDVDLEDPGFGDDVSIKDIRNKVKRSKKDPEKPFVEDEEFKRGYIKDKVVKQRRLDRKRGKQTSE